MGSYSGSGFFFARELALRLLLYPFYEGVKRALRKGGASAPHRWYESSISGAVSGGLAGALTTPLDVLKTRRMLGLKIEFRSLFRGVFARACLTSSQGCLFFSLYEGLRGRFWVDKLVPKQNEEEV